MARSRDAPLVLCRVTSTTADRVLTAKPFPAFTTETVPLAALTASARCPATATQTGSSPTGTSPKLGQNVTAALPHLKGGQTISLPVGAEQERSTSVQRDIVDRDRCRPRRRGHRHRTSKHAGGQCCRPLAAVCSPSPGHRAAPDQVVFERPTRHHPPVTILSQRRALKVIVFSFRLL